MSKTEKQIRLCMRIMHRLIRRWYEEQGITRNNWSYGGIKQYGAAAFGYTDGPVCNLTLVNPKYRSLVNPKYRAIGQRPFIDLYETENVQ